MEILFRAGLDTAKKRRIWELDFLRGVCILIMVFDHFMVDLLSLLDWVPNFYLYSDTLAYKMSAFAYNYWYSNVRIAVRIFILFIFLSISGVSCSLSKNNNIRLLKLTGASIILTIVTILLDHFLDMGVSIYFGILHIMALSLLIYILLQKISKNKYLLLGAGLFFLILGIIIDFNNIPSVYNLSFQNVLKLLTGLVNLGADSYGVAPYTGIYLIGAFFGRLLYPTKTSLVPLLDGVWNKPIAFVGRNTIWVYLLHQPIVFGITLIIARQSGINLFF